ncbi:hypothetical protein BV898_20117, partial [Hypsibius exemplaris]
MPPKKDARKQVSDDVFINGTNVSKMGPEELIKFIISSAKELCEVKKKRSFQEQERDVFFRQLEIARSELMANDTEFLTKKRDIQKAQEYHHLELK